MSLSKSAVPTESHRITWEDFRQTQTKILLTSDVRSNGAIYSGKVRNDATFNHDQVGKALYFKVDLGTGHSMAFTEDGNRVYKEQIVNSSTKPWIDILDSSFCPQDAFPRNRKAAGMLWHDVMKRFTLGEGPKDLEDLFKKGAQSKGKGREVKAMKNEQDNNGDGSNKLDKNSTVQPSSAAVVTNQISGQSTSNTPGTAQVQSDDSDSDVVYLGTIARGVVVPR